MALSPHSYGSCMQNQLERAGLRKLAEGVQRKQPGRAEGVGSPEGRDG